MTSSRYDPDALDATRVDARVDEFVADYMDRLNAGDKLEPERILDEQPDFALELLARLETFVEMASGGGSPWQIIGNGRDPRCDRDVEVALPQRGCDCLSG